MRLLLVEDHTPLAAALAAGLERGGFAVDRAHSAAEARRFFSATGYDLVVLDIGLPDDSGLTLLSEWRRVASPPMLLLTARDQLQDRVDGLDAGADDYIVKPVEMPELIARCRAVLRRPGERAGPNLVAGSLTMNTASRNVDVRGEPLALSRREITVLEQLMLARGRVVSRALLEQAVYGFDEAVGPNALEAAVSRLRKTLGATDAGLTVVTVRGVGWMLSSATEASASPRHE